MSFGGKSWPIDSADMNLGRVSRVSNDCLGGIFDLTQGSSIVSGGGNPNWVVGDVFLKNVYSVFRANPPSVGFATLSNTATAMNGRLGAAPSATVGVAATVSGGGTAGTGTVRSSDSNGATRFEFGVMGLWFTMLLSGVVGGSLLL